MRRGEEPFHHLFVGIRRCVLLKSDYLFRSREQTGEIERDAPEQCGPIRLRRRLDVLALQPGEYELIDFVFCPAIRRRLWGRRLAEWKKRPVAFVLRALLDPL